MRVAYTGPTPDLLSALEAERHFAQYDDPPRTVATGLEAWNDACRGFGQRKGLALGWYVVLGGDTGQGKSLLALQLGVQSARQGFAVGFLSLEMAIHEIRNRFYSQMFGVDASALEPGPYFQEATRQTVLGHLDEWSRSNGHNPFYATDDLPPTVGHVIEQMDEWREQWGVCVFFLDYLQLVEAPDEVGIAREVQRISKAMRDYAHRWGVLVVSLSQYNNEGGNDRTRSPHVGHLYGGRRISQDSDMTLLLDHSRYEQDRHEPHIARSYLMLPKNRHGPKGFEIPLQWDYRTLTARQGHPDEEHLWPERGR